MLILGNRRFSQLSLCLEAAPVFHLDDARARAIIAGQQAAIEAHWDAVCDEAALGGAERAFLWRRQFLNPFAFEGFAAAPGCSWSPHTPIQFHQSGRPRPKAGPSRAIPPAGAPSS